MLASAGAMLSALLIADLRGRGIVLADRKRRREIPIEGIVGDARGGFAELGAGGLEVVLRFGRAGAVEQRLAVLLGLEAGHGQRPVEASAALPG